MASYPYRTIKAYRAEELARLTQLSEMMGGSMASYQKEAEARTEWRSRHHAREMHRRSLAARRLTDLQNARDAVAKLNITAIRCFFFSILSVVLACAMNTVEPVPYFLDAMVAAMVFVLAAWAILFMDHTMRIAALSR